MVLGCSLTNIPPTWVHQREHWHLPNHETTFILWRLYILETTALPIIVPLFQLTMYGKELKKAIWICAINLREHTFYAHTCIHCIAGSLGTTVLGDEHFFIKPRLPGRLIAHHLTSLTVNCHEVIICYTIAPIPASAHPHTWTVSGCQGLAIVTS